MRPFLLAVAVEIGWLLLIAAFSAACAYPVNGVIARDFVLINIMMALGFAFYFRMVLFFRQVFYLKFLAVQILLFFLNPILFIKAISKMQEMFYLFDTHDLSFFIAPGAANSIFGINEVYSVFKKEFILFSVGLLLLIALTELRVVLAFVKRIREME